ncbi:DUF3592 domain-containing protein [Streptomyces subrutilus]|uniref:DUF3592 domain-containing protein n=1 Tax=Streptomyces subrutilus TaxID=36818 RepID=UPI0033FB0847
MEFSRGDGHLLLLVSLGLVVALVAVALAVRTFLRWLLIRRVFTQGLLATGTVVDAYVLPGDQGRAGLQHAIVGFRAADGRAYRLDFDATRRWPLGAEVGLRYFPSSPERAVLAEPGRGTVRTTLTLVLLVCLGLAGVLVTVLGLFRWREA